MSRFFLPYSRAGYRADAPSRGRKPRRWPCVHTPRQPRAWWWRPTAGRKDPWINPERRAEREEARRLGISRKRLRKNWKREAFAS